jgi:hypothetical protein
LLLRKARKGHAATWVIKDHRFEVSTGCGAYDRRGAERALALYLAAKHKLWSTGAIQALSEEADEPEPPTDG